MNNEKIIKELESVGLPDFELESHRRRLKMALLSRGYSKKRKRTPLKEFFEERLSDFMGTISDGLVARRPVWRVALTTVLIMLFLFATFITIPQVSGTLKEALFPEGTREIGGPQLTADEQKRATDILNADPGIREILARGAVIDKILPIQVEATMVNPDTGRSEPVKETWAQAWIVLNDKDWGVQIDLVRGKIVSITE